MVVEACLGLGAGGAELVFTGHRVSVRGDSVSWH